MSDEHFSLSPTAPPPPTQADYEAIAAAVMGTVRGRWFLAEFAKRNRNADSALILERIDRIEKLVHEPPALSPAERVRIDLVEMAKAIAQTRSEIAAIKPDGDAKGTLSEATEELDSIVHTTERATSDILAAAEQVQEIAWTLRERGADGATCDALDQRATDIYSACSFQDLTGQRIRKVVDVLRFLEDRIRAMIGIWGEAMPEPDAPAAAAPHVGEDRTVPHLEQQEIDRLMPSGGPVALNNAKQNGPDLAAAASDRDLGVVVTVAARAVPPAPDATEAAAAAEPVTAAGIIMTPAMAVVGATALALDLRPIETARQGELAREPAVALAPQPDPTTDVATRPEAAAHPAAQPESMPEPVPEIEAEAAPSEPRTDPAAVLKRILAIIRAPNGPPADPVAASEASTAPMAPSLPARTAAVPEVEVVPAAPAAAMSIPAPAAADDVAADGSGPEAVVAAAAAAEGASTDRSTAQPREPAEVRAPPAGIDDAADDILMPLPGPVTVDQAVDAMLKAPARVVPAARTRTDAAAPPAEEPATGEPPVARAGSPELETETAAAAEPEGPVVIAAPEFTVAPAPVAPAGAAPESGPSAEVTAGPAPEPGQSAEVTAAPPTATAASIAEPAEPAPQAADIPARPAPRYPALAAITGLSDDDKIALFS